VRKSLAKTNAEATNPTASEAKKSGRVLLPSVDSKPQIVSERATTNGNQGDAPGEQIAKGIDDIKRLLGSQNWGLSADQLVTLSRRMAAFASLVNGWSGSSGGDLITSILGNPDSNRFATSLIAALRSAG